MRTTLSLDDDVAAQLESLRERGRSWKELVNTALRAGLNVMQHEERRNTGPFTHPTSAGRPFLPDVDDVSEVLAIVEGDRYR